MPRHGKDRGRPAPRARQSSAAARDILPVGCLSPRMGTFPEARELAALGARPLESITVRLRSGRASLHARARTPALPAGPLGRRARGRGTPLRATRTRSRAACSITAPSSSSSAVQARQPQLCRKPDPCSRSCAQRHGSSEQSARSRHWSLPNDVRRSTPSPTNSCRGSAGRRGHH